MTRPGYRDVVERLALMEPLAAYDPHLAGTPPLGLDTAESDIDVICHAPDGARFAQELTALFGDQDGFRLRQWTDATRPVIASFEAQGWTIEIFGHPRPVAEQAGWRHFLVERRLLALGGDAFRAAIMTRRLEGLKTEPAFAAALGLAGDPYAALLALEERLDEDLKRTLSQAGFGTLSSG
jgi:hypothetical protein